MSFPGTSGPLYRRMFFLDFDLLVYYDDQWCHMRATTDSVACHCTAARISFCRRGTREVHATVFM